MATTAERRRRVPMLPGQPTTPEALPSFFDTFERDFRAPNPIPPPAPEVEPEPIPPPPPPPFSVRRMVRELPGTIAGIPGAIAGAMPGLWTFPPAPPAPEVTAPTPAITEPSPPPPVSQE